MSILAKQDTSNYTGNENLYALMQLVADPQKFQQKLETLQETQQRCEEKIALVGPAEDVLNLREEAIADRAKARQELEFAQIQARELLESAQTRAQELNIKSASAYTEEIAEKEAKLAELKQELAQTSSTTNELLERQRVANQQMKEQQLALHEQAQALDARTAMINSQIKERETQIRTREEHVTLALQTAQFKQEKYNQCRAEIVALAQEFIAKVNQLQ